ncbi:hypothetical protein GEMRC1_010074 [Eukaryota sp. GEM-RC1]
MFHPEPPLKSSRFLDDDVSDTDTVVHNARSSGISSSCLSSNSSPPDCHSFYPPSNHLYFQQSLLIVIHVHSLRLLLRSLKTRRSRRTLLLKFKQLLPTFCDKVAYVSHHFCESARLSIKIFLQSSTFHVTPKDLPQLCSLASHFGVDVQSVFLHVNGNFYVGDFLNYSHIVSGLEFVLKSPNGLGFVKNSSLFFPRLKQLDVTVDVSTTKMFLTEFFL